ncbi:putative colanic acid biosysnthesis UDP-glucose lipid carrier transferase [Pustulibacterium marinum]|uniref:Putative colanic acid biosysnthesis UDP-glucose lipid carrier transferase n=1 Tax=Pustulibacterium marinum TaxID=1224947 RepID=A0A1I7ETR4_9FLAO|nr:undecaprenyl-phosphate glucose phosphotransferase [Pustulibacterium marinum]SFU27310.1 putative colanic acid biosysnthesis UDP-glucose lipid carrier transferase [Pustulibacterium marinum]
MSSSKKKRFSGLLRPLSFAIDLIILNVFGFFLLFSEDFDVKFYIYISIVWFFTSLQQDFYDIHRYTNLIRIASKIFKQGFIILLFTFSYFSIFYEENLPPTQIVGYALMITAAMGAIRIAIFFFMKRYRRTLGGNQKRIVIIGQNRNTLQLKDFFERNPEYGYNFCGFISFGKNATFSTLEGCFSFIIDNNIDEIYCSLAAMEDVDIAEFIAFADNNLKLLKFLPDNKEIFSKQLKYEYYGYTPILSLRNISVDEPINRILKRGFDILFSSLVIVLVLSWLTPLIALIIKIESKGPVFFKQKRSGVGFHEFECFKFRSMTPNKDANKQQATKGDARITKVGRILRKTSIDELPQFYNVFLGDMSVVGPRPHMISHTENYAKKIDKFMVRHFIKPGITGLAQVRGYRGEIETDNDIINRVKYDIFYIENWNILLDLKIVFLTVYNAVKGEDKAY